MNANHRVHWITGVAAPLPEGAEWAGYSEPRTLADAEALALDLNNAHGLDLGGIDRGRFEVRRIF